MPFVKLDCGMLNSTIWMDRVSREVFITALLMAEPRELLAPMPQIVANHETNTIDDTGFVVPAGWYGYVPASGPGVVRRAGLEMEEGMEAILRLGEPDPQSRSEDFEGRRMVRIDGGYLVLNYFKYRDRDYSSAERSRRYRMRKAAGLVESRVSDVTPRVATPKKTRKTVSSPRDITQAEVEVEVEEEEYKTEILKTLPQAAKVTRKPDPIWDALAEGLGHQPVSGSDRERGSWNAAVAELKRMGATEAQILCRTLEFRIRWPNVTCTPLALAKHWASLGVPTTPPAPKESNRERQQREMLERLASHAPNPEPGDVVKGPRREDRGFSPIPDNPTTIEGILESLPSLPPSPPPWEELDEPEAQVAVGSMGAASAAGIDHSAADHVAPQPDKPDEAPSQVTALPVDPFQRRHSTRIEQR